MNVLSERQKGVNYLNDSKSVKKITITTMRSMSEKWTELYFYINGVNPDIYPSYVAGRFKCQFYVPKGAVYYLSEQSSGVVEWKEEELCLNT